jgi:hypothetical protein
VPAVAKDSFECPPDHVEKFKELLGQTEAILVIGWRAQEMTFRKLLLKYLGQRTGMRVRIVSACAQEAQATQQSLEQCIQFRTVELSEASNHEECAPPISSEVGFSEYVTHYIDQEL